MSSWRTKSSKIVYTNPWISVREDEVIRPDGSDGIYGVVQYASPGVFVVPVDENGNTILVLQERYVLGRETWEIVGGATDGEDYEVAAKRELLEESGYEAQSITKILEFDTLNGTTTHHAGICIASNLTKVSDNLDPVDGIIAIRKVPLIEVRNMIFRGEITDTLTIASVLAVIEYFKGNTHE